MAEKREAIAAIAKKYGVRRLFLFGSALSDEFDPARSDLDFLVEFVPQPPAGHARSYFGLIEDLERLFGRPVDLVEASAMRNPYFREDVERTRQALYEAA